MRTALTPFSIPETITRSPKTTGVTEFWSYIVVKGADHRRSAVRGRHADDVALRERHDLPHAVEASRRSATRRRDHPGRRPRPSIGAGGGVEGGQRRRPRRPRGRSRGRRPPPATARRRTAAMSRKAPREVAAPDLAAGGHVETGQDPGGAKGVEAPLVQQRRRLGPAAVARRGRGRRVGHRLPCASRRAGRRRDRGRRSPRRRRRGRGRTRGRPRPPAPSALRRPRPTTPRASEPGGHRAATGPAAIPVRAGPRHCGQSVRHVPCVTPASAPARARPRVRSLRTSLHGCPVSPGMHGGSRRTRYRPLATMTAAPIQVIPSGSTRQNVRSRIAPQSSAEYSSGASSEASPRRKASVMAYWPSAPARPTPAISQACSPRSGDPSRRRQRPRADGHRRHQPHHHRLRAVGARQHAHGDRGDGVAERGEQDGQAGRRHHALAGGTQHDQHPDQPGRDRDPSPRPTRSPRNGTDKRGDQERGHEEDRVGRRQRQRCAPRGRRPRSSSRPARRAAGAAASARAAARAIPWSSSAHASTSGSDAAPRNAATCIDG